MSEPREVPMHGNTTHGSGVMPAVPVPTTEPASERFVLRLDWVCTRCGWHVEMDAPGFAGDGEYHYPDGRYQCGPLIARRARAEAGT